MPLTVGARLGPYEIVSAIGAGGMGEVYRARDTRLGRDVAIKVLPESFANDAERLARFQREAQLLASLNHPNIATIHGLEEADEAGEGSRVGRGVRALVMELVEGPTLAERIAEGPIPVDEALPIARQIAEALEAAHERGVIHRDLKPANIKLTLRGQVKVLDFGLAKLAEADSAAVGSGAAARDFSMSPTLTVQATIAGVILGTTAYMSPEQARGKPVDRRADIWAFGCVLYEILSGKQAFDTGDTVSDAVAAILKNEPDWTAIPPETPSNIRTLLRRCLQKDPNKRLPHIGIARMEIDDPAAPVMAAAVTAPTVSRSRRSFSWPLATVTIVAMTLIYSALPWLQNEEQPVLNAPEIRTSIVTPTSTDPISLALSPDGKQIVFVASANGVSQLWLRRLDKEAAQPLRGTEGGRYPFWSPDSRSIGFSTGGRLMRLDLDGGAAVVLATLAAGGRGGTWSKDGVILIAPNTLSPLMRVSASGGEAVPATKLVGATGHRFPQFLPDGRRFVFFGFGSAAGQGIYLGSLDSQEITKIASTEGPAVYTQGLLYWLRGGTSLVAQRLDVDQRRLVGEVVTVADQVATDSISGAMAVSVSQSGLIAYRTSGSNYRQLTWHDRTGRMLGTIGPADDSALLSPRVSPDGRRVVATRSVQGNQDLWLLDGTRVSRFTFDPSLDRFPLWSADGSRVLFDSTRKGTRDLYVKSSTGASNEELVLASMADKSATDWSTDGRFVMYRSIEGSTGRDLMVLPLTTGRPWSFLSSPFEENLGFFSPDIRWVAYQSNESGRFEVYVRPFVEPGGSSGRAGGQWQISTSGGIQPHWRHDGAELYYIDPSGQMMAVSVRSNGSTFEAGAPVKLFDTHIYGGGADIAQGNQYDVAPDGRFLINTVLDEATPPITIVQNWKPPTN